MHRLTAFALAIAAAVALTSCGEEEDARLLPGNDAREITTNLDAVEQLASEGECAGAEEAAGQVSAQVESLEGVDAELRRALERGAARLNEVLASCEEEEVEKLEPAPEASEGDDEDEEREREKEEKKREREEEKAEKEAKKEAEREEREEEREPPPPTKEVEPPGDPSGGISPGAAVKEDED